MENLSNIEAELRDLSKEELRRTAIRVNVCEPQPTVCGKPICAYFAEIADRIKEAAWREERLMLSLMLYAVEDYVEDLASDKFKACVRAACERLGLEYRPSAKCLQDQIADRIGLMDGEARGIIIGLELIHGLLQKVAKRAVELNDKEMLGYMEKLHLVEKIEGDAK